MTQLLLTISDNRPAPSDLHRLLVRRFGAPEPCYLPDPVSQLVLTLVGGRTPEAVSKAAFEALAQRFGSWEQLRDAAPDQVLALMAPVTFAVEKVLRLQAALRMITARCGGLELDFLAGWPVGSALTWLERLPGVGRKSSAATLNFSTLRMRALVIDTHHLRVLRRLGLIRPQADTKEAFRRMMPLLPAEWTAQEFDDHHCLIKRLGQEICRYQRADCEICPLRKSCAGAGLGAVVQPVPTQGKRSSRESGSLRSFNLNQESPGAQISPSSVMAAGRSTSGAGNG